MIDEDRRDPGAFLDLKSTSKKGVLKIYLGGAAGVGKTYRMLEEAHHLRDNGHDVVLGFIETHGRKETQARIGELESMLAQNPTRERVARQLMLALYRSGHQTGALSVYERTRIHLATEFGLRPGPALTALQLQILRKSSSLDLSDRRWRDFSSSSSLSRSLLTRVTLTPERNLAPRTQYSGVTTCSESGRRSAGAAL